MNEEFVSPDFVLNSDPETIQERMMRKLPVDISDMPLDFPYDFTMPTAIELSRFRQHDLVRTLMLMHYMWAWGEWLDMHGNAEKVTRKPAVKATGYVTVTGTPGFLIPSGFVFCTEGTADAPSKEYESTKETVIDETGAAEVPVAALIEGFAYNTTAGTVLLQKQINKDILSVTNINPITGGTDIEDDEAYRERIDEKVKSSDISYIGNDFDYERWAKEVPGVVSAVTEGAWDGAGTVKVVVAGQNGSPVSEEIIDAVYDHIASPDDESRRLLPSGGIVLTIATVQPVTVTYSAVIELEEGFSIDNVCKAFLEALVPQYNVAKKERKIRYTDVHSLLSGIPGVADFKNFLANGASQNILVDTDDYPTTSLDDLEFTGGTI